MLKQTILPHWLAVILFLSFFLAPLPFLTQLQPDNRAEVFFPEDAPVRQLEIELRKQFPEDDVLIVLFSDISETDRYNRLLRNVYLEDGTFVNIELVRLGFAQIATYPPDVAHQD